METSDLRCGFPALNSKLLGLLSESASKTFVIRAQELKFLRRSLELELLTEEQYEYTDSQGKFKPRTFAVVSVALDSATSV